MKSDNYSTPGWLYDRLDEEFHFDDDACSLFEGLVADGLSREWGKRVFMNPPYSDPTPWVRRAYEESQKGAVVVAILRGDTSTKWFHDRVYPYAEIRFLKGRVKFGGGNPAPFASIIAVWRNGHELE